MKGTNFTVEQAQADQRRAYANGGPGTFISGLVWLVAGAVYARTDLATGFAALFFGGFLIFPMTLLVTRVILRIPAEDKSNPLIKIVPESTVPMVAMLGAAWLLLPAAPEAVMPVAMLAVATHYFPFQSAYGLRIFWLLAAITSALACAAFFMGLLRGPPLLFAMGAIELAFGAYLFTSSRRQSESVAA